MASLSLSLSLSQKNIKIYQQEYRTLLGLNTVSQETCWRQARHVNGHALFTWSIKLPKNKKKKSYLSFKNICENYKTKCCVTELDANVRGNKTPFRRICVWLMVFQWVWTKKKIKKEWVLNTRTHKPSLLCLDQKSCK